MIDQGFLSAGEPRRPFNVLDALIGVITRPVETLREVAAARPWPLAFGLAIAIALLRGLAGLTAPPQDVTALFGGAEVPPEIIAFTRAAQSPTATILSALIFTPLGLVIGSGILYLIARLLRGQGAFTGLLSTLAFASLPGLVQAPFTAVLNLLGVPFLGGLLSLGFGIWALVLQVIGIRESMHFSTGRAVATLLIPVALVTLAVCAIVGLLVALIAGQTGGTAP